MKKELFNINNFKFRIIKMDVYNASQSIEMEYSLLVDDFNFIHDYKIFFKKLEVRNITTKSHEITKRNSDALHYRKIFLNDLGLEHLFQDKDKHNKRKNIYLFNYSDILKSNLNTERCLINYRKLTFQNINYILSGSNATGEGKGKGTFYTSYKSNNINFGFFLQCLNVSKDIDKRFENIDYSSAWEKSPTISFSRWLDNSEEIRRLFIDFKINKNEWKNIKKEFKENYRKKRYDFISLENEINKLRREQKERVKRTYGIVKLNMLQKNFFNLKILDDKVVYAHIKPVWKIKEEYMNNKDKKILGEISDINNFLPLPSDIHDMYDNYMFYWNVDGKIINISCQNLDRLKKYCITNNHKLQEIFYYLNEYKKIIKAQ